MVMAREVRGGTFVTAHCTFDFIEESRHIGRLGM